MPSAELSNDDHGSSNTDVETSSTRSMRPRGVKPGGVPISAVRSGPPAVNEEGEKHCCCEIKLSTKRDEEEAANWCQCEGSCKKWYHLWCMGFDSMKALHAQYPDSGRGKNKPWLCFECRFRENPFIAFLSEEDKQNKLIDFKDLAMFRLTLKLVIQKNNLPDSPSSLRRRFGCTNSTATSLWKRLEDEAFISPVKGQPNTLNSELEESIRTGQKPRSKQKGRRSALVKYTITRGRGKGDMTKYFDGSYKLEEQIMGLKELKRGARKDKKRKNAPDDEAATTHGAVGDVESQTQLIENVPPFPLSAQPRAHDKELRTYSKRPAKKPKVSLAERGIGPDDC